MRMLSWCILVWMGTVLLIGGAALCFAELPWLLAGLWGNSFSDTKLLFLGIVLVGLLLFFGLVAAALVVRERRLSVEIDRGFGWGERR